MPTKCLVCSSIIFTLQDGASTCIECGSHQLNFVELVDDEEAWDPNRTRFFVNPFESSKKDRNVAVEQDTFDWSYIEAYNIILKRWTDILVQFGASNKFRDAVFKLWICYLQKRGIAFRKDENIDINQEEKVGVLSTRDMVALKKAKLRMKEKKKVEKKPEGLDCIKEKILRKKMRSRNSTNSSVMGRFITNQLSETINTVNDLEEKMDVDANEEVEEEEEEEEELDASCYERNASNIEEVFSDLASEEEETPEMTTKPNKEDLLLDKRRKMHVINNSHNFKEDWVLLAPTRLTLEKLLAIVYLGLLLADEDILLLDLLRWCREDFIPYFSAGYLLPKSKVIESEDSLIFNRSLPCAVELRFYAGTMAFYLSLQTLPLPSLEHAVNTLVDALRLPDDVRSTALHTFKCFVFKQYSQIPVPPIETAAAATILLTFKVTFGLDDVHEEILSDCADAINKILKAAKKQYRVFSWRKWHKYMNRVLNWTDQMMFSNWPLVKRNNITAPIDVDRFNNYFWSKGIWKTPIDRATKRAKNSSTWDSCLLNYSLGLNLKKLDQVIDAEPVFQVYTTPIFGLVDQYIHGAQCYDAADVSKEQFKIAEKLSSVSFASHRFNWLLHRQEVQLEFQDIKAVEIIKIPLKSTKKCRQIVTKQRKEHFDYIFVPDPLKNYHVIDTALAVDKLPGNFQWLLRLLSRICETSEEDILKQFIRIEGKFLTMVRYKKKDKKYISIAEGENVREILK